MPKIDQNFFLSNSVETIARQLVGSLVFTNLGNKAITGGIIVETEAYSYSERGCHAYNNKKTERNKAMFLPGGHAYVYVCYGIHHMLNIVTNQEGLADAVLIRAIEPIEGMEEMLRRANQTTIKRLTSGPGKLAKALGVDRQLDAAWLQGDAIWLERGKPVRPHQLVATTRIGIEYAGNDSLLPWRFYLKDSEWISKR